MQAFRKNIARRWALGFLVSSVTFAGVAFASLSSIGNSDVSFLAKGPLGVNITGTTSSLTASEAGGTLKISVPLRTIKTGMDLRDGHFKERMNTEKHPNVTLEVSRSSLKFPADKQSVEGAAKGKFTMNGKTLPQDFKYKVHRTGSDYHVQGLMSVDYTKHGLKQVCEAGVCVKKDVDVKVKFKLREK